MNEPTAYDSAIRACGIGIAACCFAFFLHGPGTWPAFAWPALLVTAWMISRVWMKNPGVLADRDLWIWRNKLVKPLVAGIMLSATAAIRYRQSESMSLIPLQAYYFTWISLLIGLSEEILFRGIIQGEAARWHPAGAILISAFFFAAYKALLFVFPRPENQTDPLIMFSVTLLAGLLLGYLRHRSNSLWPGLVAHGLFDIWVYMDTPSAPWWVW